MIIRGLSIIERNKDESGSVSLVHYLQVETSTGIRSQIPFEDYRRAYEEGSKEIRPATQNIDVVDSSQVGFSLESTYAGANLNPVLCLFLERLDIVTEKLTEDSELIIQSELAEFLELPWESVVGETFVFREVVCRSRPTLEDGGRAMNFLLLMSHAHQPDKPHLGDDINKEIVDVIEKIISNNKPLFRIDNVHFVKHATRRNLEAVEWNRFNLIHIALHGESDGNLCLEDLRVYDKIERISKEDFLAILQRNPKPYFSIVYLSFCFSGGGIMSTSLAFDLIKGGLSESVIGYNGGVGSPSAKKFSSLFYSFLTYGRGSRSSFKEALRKYKEENINSEYTPMFYTRT